MHSKEKGETGDHLFFMALSDHENPKIRPKSAEVEALELMQDRTEVKHRLFDLVQSL